MPSYNLNNFAKRHIGISTAEKDSMLKTIGVASLDQLMDETVPASIRMHKSLNLLTHSRSTNI